MKCTWTVFSSLASPALQYSSTLSHKDAIFGKILLNIKCVLWFSLQVLSETFLILRRVKQNVITNVYWYVTYRYYCPILRKLEFYRNIFKNAQKSNFTKALLVGAELFYEEGTKDRRDGQTDMDEARNFANARKNGHFKVSLVLRIQSGVTGKNVGTISDFVKDLFVCRFLTCISISHG